MMEIKGLRLIERNDRGSWIFVLIIGINLDYG